MRALPALVIAIALGLSAATAEAASPVESAWVEYGPHKSATARAITTAEECPGLEVGGVRMRAMKPRVLPDPPAYPNLVCQLRVGENAASLTVGDFDLPVPQRRSQRIVIVGDTGCRMEGTDLQACRDPAQWPFAEVAGSIAEWGPDAIVHVGDYHYRETKCLPNNSGCEGSPFGFNWVSWDADFFTPAAPALEAAPWVFTRGNHEECGRAGVGWFRYLYQRSAPATCQDYTSPLAVPLGRLQINLLDSSEANDDPAQDPGPYVPQFAKIADNARAGSWFVTHRPLWGVAPDKKGTEFDALNDTLQAASGNALPDAVDLSISGHVHLAEVLDYASRPSQLIVGNGGTELDDDITAPLVGAEVAGEAVEAATVNSIFGFVTMRRIDSGWRMRIRAVDGTVLNRCRTVGRDAVCSGPA